MNHKRWPLVAAAFLTAAAFAGCHAPETMGSVFEYTTTDYAFAGPSTMPAGWVLLKLKNDGPDFHHIQLYKLGDGHSAEDLYNAMVAGEHPMWADAVGGPNSPMPGAMSEAWVHLEAGDYAMICEIPDRQGTPHIEHGMWKAVTVEGESGAEPPTGTTTVNLEDFGFGGDLPMTAGHHMVRAHNMGQQPHELTLFKLNDGANTTQLLQALGPNSTGPPPAAIIGGVTGIGSGDEAFVPFDLEPGSYTFVCFLGDPTTGAPHFALGMVREFQVN